MNDLEKARLEINAVDREMADLFEKRMKAAAVVAEYKKNNGIPIYDGKREREVIEQNSLLISDTSLREYYVNFITDVMKTSRAYQSRLISGMRIAYSGTVGAFAYIAAGKIFGIGDRVPFGNFRDAYNSVVSGNCDCAVLPLENSFAGEVGQTIDMTFSGPLFITGMYDLPVIHDLAAPRGSDISQIKTVVSHPQALSQCAEFIHKSGLDQIEYENTAKAAEYVAKLDDKSIAAICSSECAEIFGLTTIDRHINESRTNTTRFGVFSRSLSSISSQNADCDDSFIIMFTVRNEAGSLAKAVNIIGKYGFNMSALRSRPMKELLWSYYFYVECEGSFSDGGNAMLDELSSCCEKLKLVGVYKKKTL